MLRFLTAGESHGPALVVIVDGMPAGVRLGPDDLTPDLARRQLGYGRGRRMAIETDRAEILSGVRRGQTLGSPIALQIKNKDWAKPYDVVIHDECSADVTDPEYVGNIIAAHDRRHLWQARRTRDAAEAALGSG